MSLKARVWGSFKDKSHYVDAGRNKTKNQESKVLLGINRS